MPPRRAKLRSSVATHAHTAPQSARPTRNPTRSCGTKQRARRSTPRPPPFRSRGTIPFVATRLDAAGTSVPRTCPPNKHCRARAKTRRRGQDKPMPTAAIRIRARGRPPAPPSTRHRSPSSEATNLGRLPVHQCRLPPLRFTPRRRGRRRRRGSVRRSQCGRRHRATPLIRKILVAIQPAMTRCNRGRSDLTTECGAVQTARALACTRRSK